MIEINDNSNFIAAVLEVDGNIEVWLNTRQHWNERGSLVSFYPEKLESEVELILDVVKLCSLQESIFEPCRNDRDLAKIKTQLLRMGVMLEPDFQSWAEKEIADNI